MKTLALCLLNTLLMALGQIIFKLGMKDRIITSFADIIHALFSPIILSGIALYGFTTLLWLYILSKTPISFAYPIQALTFPIVLIASLLLFGESVSLTRWIGVAVIMLGVFIVAMK